MLRLLCCSELQHFSDAALGGANPELCFSDASGAQEIELVYPVSALHSPLGWRCFAAALPAGDAAGGCRGLPKTEEEEEQQQPQVEDEKEHLQLEVQSLEQAEEEEELGGGSDAQFTECKVVPQVSETFSAESSLELDQRPEDSAAGASEETQTPRSDAGERPAPKQPQLRIGRTSTLGESLQEPQPQLRIARRSKLGESLQEETLDCILGSRSGGNIPAVTEPQAASLLVTPGPVLLGRTRSGWARQRQSAEALQKVQHRAAEARRQQTLRRFLMSSGFRGANEKQSRSGLGKVFKSFSYPLHAAVTANDAEVVEALLQSGADRAAQDSRNFTPLGLARKLDRGGSHQHILKLLEG